MPVTPPAKRNMSISVKEPGPCQHRVHIQVNAEEVRPVRESVIREVQRTATIAGFRKGKAPREFIERQYPSEIREETVRRLTREALEQVTAERGLKPVGPFEVIKLDFNEAKGLELEAQVEVEPEFKLGDYRGIPLTRQEPTVTPEELENALKQLQESAAELVPAGEGKPKEKKLPALDDEFAKDVGFEHLAVLRLHLEAKLREQKAREQEQALEQALCDELLTRHRFEVPPRLVSHQAEQLVRDFQTRLLLAGMSEEQAKESLEKYREQLKTNAARHVKLAFLLDRIATQEHLTVTQDEIVDRLWVLARQWRKEPSEVRRLLDAKGLWNSVISSIRQDKTIRFLMETATITGAEPAQAIASPAQPNRGAHDRA